MAWVPNLFVCSVCIAGSEGKLIERVKVFNCKRGERFYFFFVVWDNSPLLSPLPGTFCAHRWNTCTLPHPAKVAPPLLKPAAVMLV